MPIVVFRVPNIDFSAIAAKEHEKVAEVSEGSKGGTAKPQQSPAVPTKDAVHLLTCYVSQAKHPLKTR